MEERDVLGVTCTQDGTVLQQKRVILKLKDFHALVGLILPHELAPGAFQFSNKVRVDFVPVPVALINELLGVVQFCCLTFQCLEYGAPRTKTHSSTHMCR